MQTCHPKSREFQFKAKRPRAFLFKLSSSCFPWSLGGDQVSCFSWDGPNFSPASPCLQETRSSPAQVVSPPSHPSLAWTLIAAQAAPLHLVTLPQSSDSFKCHSRVTKPQPLTLPVSPLRPRQTPSPLKGCVPSPLRPLPPLSPWPGPLPRGPLAPKFLPC